MKKNNFLNVAKKNGIFTCRFGPVEAKLVICLLGHLGQLKFLEKFFKKIENFKNFLKSSLASGYRICPTGWIGRLRVVIPEIWMCVWTYVISYININAKKSGVSPLQFGYLYSGIGSSLNLLIPYRKSECVYEHMSSVTCILILMWRNQVPHHFNLGIPVGSSLNLLIQRFPTIYGFIYVTSISYSREVDHCDGNPGRIQL